MLRSLTLIACFAAVALGGIYFLRESRRSTPITIEQELVWRSTLEIEPRKSVSGKGSSVISFYNRGEASVAVNVSPGIMWSVSKDSLAEWSVESPIPPEVTALFPRTLRPGEVLLATFDSGGQATIGKRSWIRIPATIDGTPSNLEGISKLTLKE